MPLKWEKHTIKRGTETVEIHCLGKYRPSAILRAVEAQGVEEPESYPPVFKHGFGNQAFAVRHYFDRLEDAKRVFDTLRKTADAGAAVLEMPVALITQTADEGGRTTKLVTLWKGNTRPMREYLQDKAIGEEEKVRAAVSAIQQLAKLHAAGFIHDKSSPNNFVVDNRGSARLVDPTRVEIENGEPRYYPPSIYYDRRSAPVFFWEQLEGSVKMEKEVFGPICELT